MKMKFILVVVVFCCIFLSTYFVNDIHEVVQVKEVFNSNDDVLECQVKSVENVTDTAIIKGYVPYTKYEKLNARIDEIVKKYIDEFRDTINGYKPLAEDVKFTLEFSFDTYEYNEYLTYVIRLFADTGGAHPNTYITTVTYNTKKDELVTIETLNKEYPELIKKLSELSYNKLKENEIIKQINSENMLKDGTKPTLENFRNFAFTKDGMKIFFEKYQVAPYVGGEFEILIPYEQLGIKI